MHLMDENRARAKQADAARSGDGEDRPQRMGVGQFLQRAGVKVGRGKSKSGKSKGKKRKHG